MEAPRLVKSSKNQDLLYLTGHLYELNRTNKDGTKFWRCAKHRDSTCAGKAKTNNAAGEVLSTHEHNHLPTPDAVNASEMKANALKISKEQPDMSAAKVVSKAMEDKPRESHPLLPAKRTLKRAIYEQRAKGRKEEVGEAADDSSLLTLQIPVSVRTLDGENFLLFDSGPAVDRILIFGLERNCEQLSASEWWAADGTFKTPPLLWAQLYSVHAITKGYCLPCLFCLLSW